MNTFFALDDGIPASLRIATDSLIRANGGRKCMGRYTHTDGNVVYEDSYVMRSSAFEAIRKHLPIDGQESIMNVGIFRHAHLIFTDGRDKVYLGKLSSVTRHEAMAADAWTYDVTYDEWLICKNEEDK